MTSHCPCCGAPIPAPSASDVAANTMPPVQAAVLRALAADFGRFVPTDRLVLRVWSGDPEGGPEFANVCIAQAVSRMRPKLAAHRLAVEGAQYRGYRVVAA